MCSRKGFSKSDMQKMLLSTQTREGLRITGKSESALKKHRAL